jgi:hypothetical protein
MVVTFKLASHTKFWSLMLLFSIIFLSLGLYVAYMWVSNYALTVYMQGTAMKFFTTGDTYLIILFCICVVLVFDGVVLSFDSKSSGIIHKLRSIIEEDKEAHASEYDKYSLSVSIKTTQDPIKRDDVI